MAHNILKVNLTLVALGGVIMLTTGPRVCGFKPGGEQWIFKGNKNP
jgi:hypothetical protein